jgi:putative tricarboxylic transport membrane protein
VTEETMKRFNSHQVDVGIGAIVVALALFVLAQSLQLDFYVEGIPGPGFFPTLLAIALGLTGMILAVVSFVRAKTSSEPFDAPTRNQVMRSLGVWLAVLASVLLVPIAGFVLAMLALAAVLILGLEGQRTIKGVAGVIVIPVGAYLLFSGLLGVQLPAGVFGN